MYTNIPRKNMMKLLNEDNHLYEMVRYDQNQYNRLYFDFDAVVTDHFPESTTNEIQTFIKYTCKLFGQA